MSGHHALPLNRIPVLAIALWLALVPRFGLSADQPPGRLIDIGGSRLHLHCVGEGRPVVVLDSGLSGAATDWHKVQPPLAETNRTCVYDRAGYGWSDNGPEPRTSGRIAAELRTLLMLAGEKPPYVLVGHSFGGYNARLFAAFFPQDTVGVVLVDTPHEAQADAVFQNGIFRLLDPQGELRALWSHELLSALPAETGAIAELFGLPGKTWYSVLGEAAAFDASGKDLHANPMPPEIPVAILMHGRRILPEGLLGDQMEMEWLQAQQKLAAAQRQSHFVIARESGHFIHADQPELIVQAVHRVIEMGTVPH